jgi:hypothetical protein
MTPAGTEPANFQLVAQCLKQLRHRVPPFKNNIVQKKSCDASQSFEHA